MKKSAPGFTLVELLVVIAVVAILAFIGFTAFTNVQLKARDAKRKADLRIIYNALESYYSVNGKYPPAGVCAYGTNCYVYSTAGSSWIPALVPTFMYEVPRDPKNSACCPWEAAGYSYAYGNVSTNGQFYDLTAHLENTSDPDRCELKNYRWSCSNGPWCTAFGGSYSNQIYELSPPGTCPL